MSYALDQAVSLNIDTVRELMDEVDSVVEKSLLDGSPQIAMDFGRSIIATGQVKGIQLAKLLYELREVWSSFETDDELWDTVMKDIGISRRKAEEYEQLFRFVLRDHPALSGKPIGGLLAIVVAAREEQFSDEDWKDLEKAHDKLAMLTIRTRARGLRTKGHARLSGQIDRDGHIWAYASGGEPEHAGVLNVGAKDGTPAARLVQRIIEAAGLARR